MAVKLAALIRKTRTITGLGGPRTVGGVEIDGNVIKVAYARKRGAASPEILRLAIRRTTESAPAEGERSPDTNAEPDARSAALREMIEAGIDATMIVDSAARNFINKSDLVLVGADAITSEGNVINKIGTSQVALAAQEARTPFYVATELLKFDPQTIHGDYEAIEERPTDEIWPEAPEDLKIRNPAFEVVRRDYIHGIICEEGLISPQSILEAVRRRYPWILEASAG